jgi:general secretion pathway protein E
MTPWGNMIPTWRGTGCANCFGTGYLGRVGIFEMMQLSDELRGLIMQNKDASILTECARREGMRSLREDGWAKVATGVTTVQEVMRVTQEF